MWAIEEHKLADEDACARAQESLKAYGWTGYLTPAGKGPKGHGSGGVGWIWQEWLKVGSVGELNLEHRCLSVQLATPKLGFILLMVLYGWVDDQARTLALVDKVTKNLRKTGMPWAIMGDANISAKVMQAALSEGNSGAEVMAVGNTCCTKDGASAIDYGIVDGS